MDTITFTKDAYHMIVKTLDGVIDVPAGTYFYGKTVEDEINTLMNLFDKKIELHKYLESIGSTRDSEDVYHIDEYVFTIVNLCHSHTRYFVKVNTSDKLYKNVSAIRNFIANT